VKPRPMGTRSPTVVQKNASELKSTTVTVLGDAKLHILAAPPCELQLRCEVEQRTIRVSTIREGQTRSKGN
jgi:hypothetical protein